MKGCMRMVPDEKRVIVFGESDGVFTREFLPEPAFEASSGNIYISGVEGLVRIRPDYDIHEEEDFSVSMINLALDGVRFIPMVYPGNRLFPFRGIMFLLG